jgi:3-deoxy-manno-octulosonate cytidylyltransferase (CMP-KDO synthetase)
MGLEMVAIIPARFDSSRLPGKLLLKLEGKSILQRVYERALQCSVLDKVFIATDSELIFDHATEFGAECFLSKLKHESGTDRIAELAETLSDTKFIINLQGDEPFINPKHIEILCDSIRLNQTDIATLAVRLQNSEGIDNPNVVKIVTSLTNQALYFSRASIPYLREKNTESPNFEWLKHIGIYAFKHEVLLKLAKSKPTALEGFEKLEQLRWLQHGYHIQVGLVDAHGIGIDTERDYLDAINYTRENRL